MIPPAAQAAADRLGCRPEYIRLHWGPHMCLDRRVYPSNCPLVDPARHEEALRLMTSLEVPDTAANREFRESLAAHDRTPEPSTR